MFLLVLFQDRIVALLCIFWLLWWFFIPLFQPLLCSSSSFSMLYNVTILLLLNAILCYYPPFPAMLCYIPLFPAYTVTIIPFFLLCSVNIPLLSAKCYVTSSFFPDMHSQYIHKPLPLHTHFHF